MSGHWRFGRGAKKAASGGGAAGGRGYRRYIREPNSDERYSTEMKQNASAGAEVLDRSSKIADAH
jgi:hypothetical protein